MRESWNIRKREILLSATIQNQVSRLDLSKMVGHCAKCNFGRARELDGLFSVCIEYKSEPKLFLKKENKIV